MTLGDLILLGSIGVALWYVPRYLWRVYGGPDLVKAFGEWFFNMSSALPDASVKDAASNQTPEPPPNQHAADTYQANRGTTHRTSTKMSDAEWIALLAAAKDESGKERFTANAIAALVGGTRKDVLDQVRAIRNLPKFPDLTPEQQAFRERLGLPKR